MKRFGMFSFSLILIGLLSVGELEANPRVSYPFYVREDAIILTPSTPVIYGRFKNVFGTAKLKTDFSPQSLEKYTGKLSTSHRKTFSWYPEERMLRGFFRTNF